MSYLPVRIMFLSLKTVKNSNGQMRWVCVHAAILHDERLVSCALYRFAILRRE